MVISVLSREELWELRVELGIFASLFFLSVSTYVDVRMKNKHRLRLTQKHVMKANMLFPCLALRINTSCYSGCVILGLA